MEYLLPMRAGRRSFDGVAGVQWIGTSTNSRCEQEAVAERMPTWQPVPAGITVHSANDTPCRNDGLRRGSPVPWLRLFASMTIE
ncbi:MAG: hypothetical protein JST22_18440 [Bacteroidetes bacterium]|nr:hypothetical protein [Bacteroidota bacterium]